MLGSIIESNYPCNITMLLSYALPFILNGIDEEDGCMAEHVTTCAGVDSLPINDMVLDTALQRSSGGEKKRMDCPILQYRTGLYTKR
jgi:hypothetical protein